MNTHTQAVCVHQLIELQAIATPNAIAVIFQNQQLTYRELDEKANQLAHYLQTLGVQPETLVGICLERSIELIISILGILKVGATYLPLDGNYPTDRLGFMIKDAQSPIILTHTHLRASLPHLKPQTPNLQTPPQNSTQPQQHQYLYLDREWLTIDRLSIQPAIITPIPQDSLAYVIYTSGSTGKPKGVAMPHRPLMNLLTWQQQQFQQQSARTLQFTPISFDVSFQEIFSTLGFGGTLVLIDDRTRRNPEALLAYISEHNIERLFLPFVALQNLAEVACETPDLPLYLREVITAGEQLKITRSIAKWFTILENCTLCNQYGPSESHVVTAYTLTGSAKTWAHLPPIGQAIPHAQLYLLVPSNQRKEDAIQLAKDNEPGELAIGGIALARGYLNRPELTEAHFITNPFSQIPDAKLYRTGDLVRRLPDGNLEFIERIDDQVKIGGVRIELGEIEAEISQHPAVKDVVVVAKERQTGDKYLVGYIVPVRAEAFLEAGEINETSEITDFSHTNEIRETHELEKQLRSFLKQSLPTCMMPSVFLFMPELPLTPSGKVDRRALPTLTYHRPAVDTGFIAPRDSVEHKLANIWSTILAISSIGVEDNFFELGGSSLKAIQLIHQVRKTFSNRNSNLELPIITLFDSPTIAQFARSLQIILKKGATVTSDNISVSALEAEAALEPSITPGNLSFRFSRTPQHILMTGVTGFLGAFLLQELLEQTQAQFHCLVRADNAQIGQQEIEANLQKYDLWQQHYGDRIIPVMGDLALPRLGLTDEVWNKLANEVEIIYHSGAAISLINPYSALRDANVSGTQELLKLATQKRLKVFHFISTLDVFQSSQAFKTKAVPATDQLNAFNAINFDGYTKTKWVSEKMVWAAKSRGLPVCVYRPAMISGHSQTGIANTSDLMSRLIKGFIQLGCAPQSEMVINIAPVNFFTKAVVHLAQQPSSLGQAFNLVNPNPVSMEQFVQAIGDCGYPIQLVDHEHWDATLLTHLDQLDSIVSVLTAKTAFDQPSYIERSSVNAAQVDCQNVWQGLANTDIQCPQIDAKFLEPYLTYFAHIGFLEPIALTTQNKPLTFIS